MKNFKITQKAISIIIAGVTLVTASGCKGKLIKESSNNESTSIAEAIKESYTDIINKLNDNNEDISVTYNEKQQCYIIIENFYHYESVHDNKTGEEIGEEKVLDKQNVYTLSELNASGLGIIEILNEKIITTHKIRGLQ